MDEYLLKEDTDVPDHISERLVVSDIVKEYPNMLQIVIYHNDYSLPLSGQKRKPTKEQRRQDNIDRSVRRTRSYISDLILCNEFDLWVTFTFSGKKGDRFNPDYCRGVMSRWLHRQQYKYRDMQYLIVPEQHKRCQECVKGHVMKCPHDDAPKALHFHALISNWDGILKYSGHKTSRGQEIYNIPGYRAGFTEVVKIGQETDDTARIAQYIQKYITKDMVLTFGKKRYWVSQGLKRPTTCVNGLSKYNLWNLVKNSKPIHINGEYELFHIPFHRSVLTNENQTRLIPDVNITRKTKPFNREPAHLL